MKLIPSESIEFAWHLSVDMRSSEAQVGRMTFATESIVSFRRQIMSAVAVCVATILCSAVTTANAIPPIQTIKLTSTDGAASDQFGNATALSNLTGFAGAQPNIAIVGLRYDDIGAAVDRGSANVYKLNASGVWVFEAKLTASDGLAGDTFGYSVAIFGNTAIVGAPFDDNTLVDQGSAYIFTRSTAGVWTQTVKVLPTDPGASDYFGYSVGITNTVVATGIIGDLAIVGSVRDDNTVFTDQGSAYVFKRATAGTWAQESKFVVTGTDQAAGEDFGWSVSIYGDRALVGAPADDISSVVDRGSAYTYKRATTGIWTLEAKLVATDGALQDYFGYCVSLFNNQAMVSAPYDDFSGATDRGSAYLFQLSGTSTWTQEAKIVASDGVGADYFGASVGLQGNLAVATAPNDDGPAQGGATTFANIGSAYLYVQTGTSTWTQQPRFTAADGQIDKFFGAAVGIYGEVALIGANGDDVGTPLKVDQGSAYIFNLRPIDCNNNGIPDPEDIATGIAQDCNLNAIPDSCDIASGFSSDVDSNAIPDECQVDCNNNDIPDSWEIALGTAPDCNANLIPDACDLASGLSLDCNANLIPDSCDIASGFSKDCNANLIPDSCDIASGFSLDCNANGRPDNCDISGGFSADVDSNGVPDSCQTDCNGNSIPDSWEVSQGTAPDCNANLIPDSCDIASGFSLDCNLNGKPDSCDIASGFSADVDSNSVPDSCQTDCNGNSIPDSWEVSQGTAPDCNANLIPDSCDVASGFSNDVDSNGIPDECKADCNNNDLPDAWEISQGMVPDCNANAKPDSCDLADGTALDCNDNDSPDSCDIASGFSKDCNTNLIPDSCDFASGFSNDIDTNGVPDECQPDCNNNDIPDSWEILQGSVPDCNSNGIPDSCDLASGEPDIDADGRIDWCERDYGDFDLNGIIDGIDLSYILSAWGEVNPPIGDLDHNGSIGGGDLTAILSRWGVIP